ncbi:hypothetical protein GCM10022225_55090 [Plantactinospora mayteni]|uniref:Uncharacterized protein n=1 Tax=Plantactinospora mayteni TaxID=566021 RepID=A0ABQ4EK37_9ACTN|nr:hypothetical protein Pma05_17010 [Plantactinospora mayteni]
MAGVVARNTVALSTGGPWWAGTHFAPNRAVLPYRLTGNGPLGRGVTPARERTGLPG